MKKIYVKRIFSGILFVVLLIGAIAKCADILEYKKAREKYTPFYESETNFDVIFLGTSHMWNHVLPMELWKDYGIASYNWGYANCTPAEDYYLIQDILKYCSPKVVVLDTYGLVEYNSFGNGKYRDDRIEQQHVQFDSLPIWSVNKINASRDVFDNYVMNIDFIWNFIMYHNRWSELGKEDFEYNISTEKGAQFLTGYEDATFVQISENEKTDIDSVCYPYYLKIIEYCEQQGIQVLCTYIPWVADENAQRVANTIGDIVEEYPNCEYVNLMPKNIIDFNTDIHGNGGHLNYSGAVKVTDWLGQYLRDNYLLEDYRGNQAWIDDYAAYIDYKQTTMMAQESLTSYLVMLSDDDFSADIEVYDQGLFESQQFKQLCRNANLSPVYVNAETDKSIRLVISNVVTKEVVEDVSFSCDDTVPQGIFAMKKVIEE